MDFSLAFIFAICVFQVSFAFPGGNNDFKYELMSLRKEANSILTDYKNFKENELETILNKARSNLKKTQDYIKKDLALIETKLKKYIWDQIYPLTEKIRCFINPADYVHKEIQVLRLDAADCFRDGFYFFIDNPNEKTETDFQLAADKIIKRIDQVEKSLSFKNSMSLINQQISEIEKIRKSEEELKKLEEAVKGFLTEHATKIMLRTQSCVNDENFKKIKTIALNSKKNVEECINNFKG